MAYIVECTQVIIQNTTFCNSHLISPIFASLQSKQYKQVERVAFREKEVQLYCMSQASAIYKCLFISFFIIQSYRYLPAQHSHLQTLPCSRHQRLKFQAMQSEKKESKLVYTQL